MGIKLIVAILAVLLTWQDNSDNEDGFVVERDGVVVGYVGVSVSSFIDPVVIPGACYRVAAFNSNGSAYSNIACVPEPCRPKGRSGKCR